MNKRNEDCYYFYNSSCNKGKDCEYRHCVEALDSNEVCKYWEKRRDCNRANCRFRHSLKSSRDRKNIQCYYETRRDCMKIHCPYLHQRSRENLLKEIKLGSNKVIFPVTDGSLHGNQAIPIESCIKQRRRTHSEQSYLDLEYETPSELSEDENDDSSRELINEEERNLIQELNTDGSLTEICEQTKADSQRTEIAEKIGNHEKHLPEISERNGGRKKEFKSAPVAIPSIPSTSFQSSIKNTKKESQNQQGAFNETVGNSVKKRNKKRSKSCTNLMKQRDGLPCKAKETDIGSVQPLQSEAIGTIHNFKQVSKAYEDNIAALARHGIDNLSLNPKDKGRDMKKKSRGRRSSANPK